MSVNEIDVNAVNKRTQDIRNAEIDMPRNSMTPIYTSENAQNAPQSVAGTTPEESIENEGEVARIAQNLRTRGTLRAALIYLRVLMFVESVLWTLMDITRARRTKLAEDIHKAK
jgi:hypothetical protein